eukprot:scaffold214873_cov83-Cyclotella_meneghiniana.AAC.1
MAPTIPPILVILDWVGRAVLSIVESSACWGLLLCLLDRGSILDRVLVLRVLLVHRNLDTDIGLAAGTELVADTGRSYC